MEFLLCLEILQELLQLEEDVKLLEEMYPQGEKVTVVNYVTCCSCFSRSVSNLHLEFRLRLLGL